MSQLESGGVFPLPDELRVYRSGAVAVSLPTSTGTAAARLQVLLARGRGPLKAGLWLIVVLVALVVLRSTVLADKPLSVDVARVTRGVVEHTVSNTRAGTVKARQRARLSPETGGRVETLPFRKGARVARGDLLLSLDASRQRARLELAAEEVRAAAARAEEACLAADLAANELARFAELESRGIASDQVVDGLSNDRDRTRAGCRGARASLELARASERLARVELASTQIKAPFSGVIAELNTEIGEWIAPGPSGVGAVPAIELLDPSSLFVTAPIDEMDAERVEVGQEVRLAVDSRRGEQFRGRLVRVAPYVLDLVEQNRTVEVEAELDDSEIAASLLPGTSADIEVVLSRRQDVLRIPTEAVGPRGQVLVVVEGRLEERTLTAGLRNWQATEVRGGLAEGELVVTSRRSAGVTAGARVSVRGQQ